MIQETDILNMNFYKKERFTGSYRGMHYLIKKDTESVENGDSSDIFHVTAWPGPYNYEHTPDEKKITAQFPFTPEGRLAVVDWLNDQWTARRDDWPEIDRGYTIYE